VLLEIIFQVRDFAGTGIASRDELEEPLEDALLMSRAGEITGGGGGAGLWQIEIELRKGQKFEAGLKLVRHTLRQLKVPQSTVIRCGATDHPVY